jgi:hypothetical protein
MSPRYISLTSDFPCYSKAYLVEAIPLGPVTHTPNLCDGQKCHERKSGCFIAESDMTIWVDGVSGQERSLRGERLGFRKSRHHLFGQVFGEAADVPQRHRLRHAAAVEGAGDDAEPQRVAPAPDEVDAALRLPAITFPSAICSAARICLAVARPGCCLSATAQ